MLWAKSKAQGILTLHYCFVTTGDIILGFMCDEYARMALAEVKMSPFTRGKSNCMEKVDVDWSRELSIVRIHHVEWVIGVIKQKYTINTRNNSYHFD